MEKLHTDETPKHRSRKDSRTSSFNDGFPSMIAPRGIGPGNGVAVQAQLETTSPGDEYEREADSMADLVLRKIESGAAGAISSAPAIQARPSVSAYGGSAVSLPSQMESRMRSSLGGGQSLPGQVRSQMESAFGQSFSQVNIHTDSAAAEMSRSIGAKAFTYGNDIYFNAGQYRPETTDGLHLLAHELTHTVQQGGKVARKEESQESESGTSFEEVFSLISNIREGFSKAKTILSGMTAELGAAVAAEIESVTDSISMSFQKVADVYHKASGAMMSSNPYVPSNLKPGIGWLHRCYSMILMAIDAASDSSFAFCYYLSRAWIECLTAPPPFTVLTGNPRLLAKAFSLASRVGDFIAKTKYHDKQVERIMDTAELYRGEDTASTVARGISTVLSSIPIYGEFYNNMSHRIMDK